ADRMAAQSDDPRKARPRANDRFVFARGDRKGQAITVADLPDGGPPVIAFPIDPMSKILREGSPLNEVLLARLESREPRAESMARRWPQAASSAGGASSRE